MSYPLLLTTVGIVNEFNEILFIKRANKPFYGLFSLPGGKLKENEALPTGAVREISEELGLQIDNIQPLGYVEFLYPGHALVFIFIHRVNTPIQIQSNPKEVSATKWVSEKALSKLGELPPNHKGVAKSIYAAIRTP